jgi:dopamine beta-monooxygenase
MVRHFRNGEELPEVNRDDFYAYEFQEIRTFRERHKVLPGDALVHTCFYDTRRHSKATLGGFNLTDEMCTGYVHYYPAFPEYPLDTCKSAISENSLENYFRHMIR